MGVLRALWHALSTDRVGRRDHADIGVTLNVYTHATYDLAEQQMAKILNFEPSASKAKAKDGTRAKRKKLG